MGKFTTAHEIQNLSLDLAYDSCSKVFTTLSSNYIFGFNAKTSLMVYWWLGALSCKLQRLAKMQKNPCKAYFHEWSTSQERSVIPSIDHISHVVPWSPPLKVSLMPVLQPWIDDTLLDHITTAIVVHNQKHDLQQAIQFLDKGVQ